MSRNVIRRHYLKIGIQPKGGSKDWREFGRKKQYAGWYSYNTASLTLSVFHGTLKGGISLAPSL